MGTTSPGSQVSRGWVLGVASVILAGLVTTSLIGATRSTWAMKVDSETYARDRQRDSLVYNARLERLEETLTDVLCSPSIRPDDRRCRR